MNFEKRNIIKLKITAIILNKIIKFLNLTLSKDFFWIAKNKTSYLYGKNLNKALRTDTRILKIPDSLAPKKLYTIKGELVINKSSYNLPNKSIKLWFFAKVNEIFFR